jgi:hypothetical protein
MDNRPYPDTSNSSGKSSCHGIPTVPLAAACIGIPNSSFSLKISDLEDKILKHLEFQWQIPDNLVNKIIKEEQMTETVASNSKIRQWIIGLVIIAVILGAFLAYQSGFLGLGNSCSSLKRGYDKAAAVEDYTKVSEYFIKMSAKGCEF